MVHELAGLELRIERHHHRTQLEDGVVAPHELGAVAAAQGHAFARTDAQAAKQMGGAVAQRIQRAVAERGAAPRDGGAVAKDMGAAAEMGGQIEHGFLCDE